AVDHLLPAREYRSRPHRLDRRRIHRLAAWARPHDPLCRTDLRNRAGLGRGARPLDARHDHVRDRVMARTPAAQGRRTLAPNHPHRRSTMLLLHRGAAALAGVALAVAGAISPAQAQDKRVLTVAEPQHQLGYLPLYLAMHKGFFAAEGIEIKVLTTDGGSAHTNAVLTGQAFAFIGGPEHNAFAKAKGAELRSVVNCVDRGNVYYVAKTGVEPTGTDWPSYSKGKTVAVNLYGGTPNSITRYLFGKWKLDPKRDLVLMEMVPGGVPAAVKTGQAQIGVTSEPMMTKGIKQGIW